MWWAVNHAVVSSGLAAGNVLSAFYLHNRQLIKLFILMTGSEFRWIAAASRCELFLYIGMYYIVIGQNNIVGS